MNAFSNFRLDRNKLLILLSLSLLVSGRVLLQLFLYRSGFISLSADEFGRTILAARWAQSPHTVWHGVWLPFHMYIFGTALRIIWEMLYVPRIIVISLGAISILLMYMMASRLLESRRIGLISAFLLAANPIHVWLSSTPLTAIPNATLIFATVLSHILYLKRNEQKYIFFGAFSLALANGFRFESWMFSIIYSISLVGNGTLLYWRKELDFRQSLYLVFGAIIPWLFPIAWIVGNYVETDNPLFFLEFVRSYKLTWYGQSRSYRNYLETFLIIDPFATVLAIFGFVICLLRNSRSSAVRWYVTMAIVPFALFAYLHGGQKEPQGNYFRYLAFFVFFSYPVVAYLIDLGVNFVVKSRKMHRILVVLIIGLLCATQINMAFQFVNDPAAEGLEVGKRIKTLRSEYPELSQRPVLIELSYWQYLAIHVGANDISSLLYDRELDTDLRQSPSLLVTDLEAFRNCLSYFDVSFVIVKSPDLRNIIESDLLLMPSEEIGSYNFYQIPWSLLEGDMTNQLCPLTFGSGF
jgi:hypothetical protein